MTSKKRGVRLVKSNFWNDLRVENNIKFTQLAVLLDVTDSCVGNYFVGRVMPRDTIIKDLCDYFGIDFDTGKSEFQKIHNEYLFETSNLASRREKRTRRNSKSAQAEVVKVENITDVLRVFYGKLDCDTFLTLFTAITDNGNIDIENVLSNVYGIIDFVTYNKIANILKEV